MNRRHGAFARLFGRGKSAEWTRPGSAWSDDGRRAWGEDSRARSVRNSTTAADAMVQAGGSHVTDPRDQATHPAPVLPFEAALVARGNKVDAIRSYRGRTGVGLRAAKDAIDGVETGETPIAPDDGVAQNPVLSVRETMPPPSTDEVALIRAGMKVWAIKAYRERTGADLKTAADVMNEYEQQ
ncbi:hypothetical protein [Actinobaculum sp. 352]|uniref:hypothetical protein n=1 Tax=Actinobaculum sp. 352 TaxID=2490946 RepID=UPI000F7F28B4|nr:hypothetical protein [Actinobaculum sp. 352]RTE49201.1 hypothetical protein EKN07_06385 [Actinobaculum sp. 352]